MSNIQSQLGKFTLRWNHTKAVQHMGALNLKKIHPFLNAYDNQKQQQSRKHKLDSKQRSPAGEAWVPCPCMVKAHELFTRSRCVQYFQSRGDIKIGVE
eukprot:1141577-Pelagomonas_calceolata.AAC.1